MRSKKMRLILIGTILLLVLVLAGYVITDFIIGQKEKAEADEAASLILYSFDANTIDKVTFDTEEGFFQMEMVDSEWAITDQDYPHEFILNSSYISVVCSYLSNLTAEKKFDTEGQTMEAYGLDTPSVLTCYAGDTAYVLEVGQPSATQEYFYVKKPDSDIVYGITFEYGSVLCGDTSYLKSSYLINEMDIDIDEIRLTTGSEDNFHLVRTEGGWDLLSPLPDAVPNTAKIGSMLTALVRFELESFISIADENTDLSQFGLNDPAHTLTVVSNTGTTTTIHFADYEDADTFLYLIYEESGQIATLSTSTASFLNTNVGELLNDEVLYIPYGDVTAVDAVVDDLRFHLDIDYANAQYAFEGEDIDALGDEGISLFKNLFDTMSNLGFESIDAAAQVNMETEPTVVFHYTMTDGSARELSLIPIDETTYWALVDGEYTGQIVRRRSISGNTGVLTFYEKMTDFLARSNAG